MEPRSTYTKSPMKKAVFTFQENRTSKHPAGVITNQCQGEEVICLLQRSDCNICGHSGNAHTCSSASVPTLVHGAPIVSRHLWWMTRWLDILLLSRE
ncbi:hypothetical protein GDO81_015133 [Engystomops pustulosus]|uniref:Uncharacterized protein n=1 Tax=Engystomops pustulosus TaxID=76066 RepID=A0AAV7ALB1_ENGPU|nr:hypothetical protein GDO81_015133 [Engystomops pustulosus]